MSSISVNYDLKWRLKTNPTYKWSSCGKLFNCKTGRRIKKTVNGRSVGYWINGEFTTLTKLRDNLEKIPKILCPF